MFSLGPLIFHPALSSFAAGFIFFSFFSAMAALATPARFGVAPNKLCPVMRRGTPIVSLAEPPFCIASSCLE